MHVQHFIIFNVIACEVSILSLGAELLRSVVGFYCALNAKVYAFFSFFLYSSLWVYNVTGGKIPWEYFIYYYSEIPIKLIVPLGRRAAAQ